MHYLKYNGRVSWTSQLLSQAKQREDAADPVRRQTIAKWHRVKQPPNSEQHKNIPGLCSPQIRQKSNCLLFLVPSKYGAYFSDLRVNKEQVKSASDFSGDIMQTGLERLEQSYTDPNKKDNKAVQSSSMLERN